MSRTSGTSAPAGPLYIGVSTKMYLGYQASLRWLSEVRAVVDARPALAAGQDVRIFVIPSFPVLAQVRSATGGDESLAPRLVLAYEPVWAIGADEPAAPAYVNAVVELIRQGLGAACPIIYGGSAGPGLLPELAAADGLFLGRFAHDAANLGRVLDEALEATRGQIRPKTPAGTGRK